MTSSAGRSNSQHPNPSMAMMASQDTNAENCWFPDIGATNHVTNDLANSNLGAAEYLGNKILVGSGTGLRIHNIGNSSLIAADARTSKPFFLHNLLHVPAITNNLISVSQFAKDNKVFF